jgi:hypothetical protein
MLSLRHSSDGVCADSCVVSRGCIPRWRGVSWRLTSLCRRPIRHTSIFCVAPEQRDIETGSCKVSGRCLRLLHKYLFHCKVPCHRTPPPRSLCSSLQLRAIHSTTAPPFAPCRPTALQTSCWKIAVARCWVDLGTANIQVLVVPGISAWALTDMP